MQLQLPREADRLAKLRNEFDETGRCSISDILLPEEAARLADVLEGELPWNRLRAIGGQRFDRPAGSTSDNLETERQHAAIEAAIAGDGTGKFAFRYDAISMLGSLPDGVLEDVKTALDSPATLEWMSAFCATPGISGTEIQATRFNSGDFLSLHHDGPSADRKVAMVLGMTREWRYDWGGNLLFPGEGDRLEGVSPGFNRLDLFAVPQFHSVTAIASSAPRPRLAISGWFVV